MRGGNPHKFTMSFSLRILAASALLLLQSSPASAAGSDEAAGWHSGFVTTTDGVRIHYLEAGAGPAILFVPGWTMPAWIWEHQITHFSETHRVVAVDPRSQGDSSQTAEGHYPAARARDIKAVVDSLGLAPVVLVGWSMGVTEAVAYVEQFGTETLAGLVLVDGLVGSDIDVELTPQFLHWAHSFQIDRPGTTKTFISGLFANPAVKADEAYLRRVTQASLRTPTNSAMALLLAYLATHLRPALAKIDKPTLIVVAQNPWMKYYEELHQLAPGSRLQVFEDAGHALFVDDAPGFNALLDEFLAGLRASNNRTEFSDEEPLVVSACALADHPAAYNHKLVRVESRVTLGFEDFSLYPVDCPDKRFAIWLDFGGDVEAPTIYCCGSHAREPNSRLLVEGFVIPLVKDSSLESLLRHLQGSRETNPNGDPCYDQECKLFEVTSTLVGRFFAGELLRKDRDGEVYGGYGHLGCCSLLAIQQVLGVEAVRTGVPEGEVVCSRETRSWNDTPLSLAPACQGSTDDERVARCLLDEARAYWGDAV